MDCSARFRASFLASAGQNARQRDRLAALALTLVGGFHERVNLQRLLGADRRFAADEELANLDHERFVAGDAAARPNAFRAEHLRAIVAFAGADAAESTDAAIL